MIYYNFAAPPKVDVKLENDVIEIFNSSRKNYGTKKIKKKLKASVSRRKIGTIMAKYGLVSKYTLKHYKHHHTGCNEDLIANIVDRKFDNREPLEVVIS
ncbi:MAG: IS3 family transposase, partial [Christensenellaceae bacterium]